jgi:hypothetical protein
VNLKRSDDGRVATNGEKRPSMVVVCEYHEPWRGTMIIGTSLPTISVNAMMSLYIPPKVLEALIIICRTFLWMGRREVKGRHCLVACDKAASPKCRGV